MQTGFEDLVPKEGKKNHNFLILIIGCNDNILDMWVSINCISKINHLLLHIHMYIYVYF